MKKSFLATIIIFSSVLVYGQITNYNAPFSAANLWGFHTPTDATPTVIGGNETYFVDQNFQGSFQNGNNNPVQGPYSKIFVPGQLRIGTMNTAWDNFKLKIQTHPTNAPHLNGIRVDHTATTGFSYGFLMDVQSATTKALVVNNSSVPNGIETFKVSGDGSVAIRVDNQITPRLESPLVIYNNAQPNDGKVFQVTTVGKVWCTEVEVALAGSFPDYVFDEDYDLKSISEVEEYILENSHLPNIPSAKEVETSGSVPIAELQLKMLEKIEELTLYVIALEKANKTLEQKVDLMELQIK